jgi:glycosyltransferase involved in cell wall biosynthesis
LAGDRLCFVQNGVDIERVERAIGNQRAYGRQGELTAITVGRLIELKNPLSILNAFAQSAGQASRLVYVGEGDLRDELVAACEASGLGDQVTMTGLIPRNSVYRHLVRADLFISASRMEGLPVAVLEAMACRCPVVLSDIPPHREIAHGVDFIPLVQPDDVAGFAQAIARIKAMSASERAELGEKCQRLAEQRFSLAAMHRGYDRLYAELIAKHGHGSL